MEPTWNPLQGTLKAPRIVAGDGSFGFNNNTINNYYSSLVPYVCIAEAVSNQPLYVRVCLQRTETFLAVIYIFLIIQWMLQSTLTRQVLTVLLTIVVELTEQLVFLYHLTPCSTQYLWLYFADSWWAPRISSDIPFCIDTYRQSNLPGDASTEVNLGGGWQNFTDLRNSGGSVDNATMFQRIYLGLCLCNLYWFCYSFCKM